MLDISAHSTCRLQVLKILLIHQAHDNINGGPLLLIKKSKFLIYCKKSFLSQHMVASSFGTRRKANEAYKSYKHAYYAAKEFTVCSCGKGHHNGLSESRTATNVLRGLWTADLFSSFDSLPKFIYSSNTEIKSFFQTEPLSSTNWAIRLFAYHGLVLCLLHRFLETHELLPSSFNARFHRTTRCYGGLQDLSALLENFWD